MLAAFVAVERRQVTLGSSTGRSRWVPASASAREPPCLSARPRPSARRRHAWARACRRSRRRRLGSSWPGSVIVIGLSIRDTGSRTGAGGTTITVGLRVMSMTTVTVNPIVATAPASAAHFIHAAPPRCAIIGSAAAVAGKDSLADCTTGTPPNVSMAERRPESGDDVISDGLARWFRLMRPEASPIGRSSGGGGSGTGPVSSGSSVLGIDREDGDGGPPLETCVGPDVCSAARNGDSGDGRRRRVGHLRQRKVVGRLAAEPRLGTRGRHRHRRGRHAGALIGPESNSGGRSDDGRGSSSGRSSSSRSSERSASGLGKSEGDGGPLGLEPNGDFAGRRRRRQRSGR